MNLMNSQFPNNLLFVAHHEIPHTRPVYVCLCVSMSVSRPEGYRVFLSLSVCFLWSVYVVAKIIVVGFTSQIIFESSPGHNVRQLTGPRYSWVLPTNKDKSFLYEVEGGEIFIASTLANHIARSSHPGQCHFV